VRFPTEHSEFPGNMEAVAPITSGVTGGGVGGGRQSCNAAAPGSRVPSDGKMGGKMNILSKHI
jgi:hypothetical protein